jgi:hypothetical protein
MDSAYDAPEIREKSCALGHVSLIGANPRRGGKAETAAEALAKRCAGYEPAEEIRYNERSGTRQRRTQGQLWRPDNKSTRSCQGVLPSHVWHPGIDRGATDAARGLNSLPAAKRKPGSGPTGGRTAPEILALASDTNKDYRNCTASGAKAASTAFQAHQTANVLQMT